MRETTDRLRRPSVRACLPAGTVEVVSGVCESRVLGCVWGRDGRTPPAVSCGAVRVAEG